MTARDVACTREYNGIYSGDHLNHVAFPMGGMGAGMICLEGTGALSHVSLRHRPDVFNEPQAFSALYVEIPTARALVMACSASAVSFRISVPRGAVAH